ncbi:sialidase family protein [Streptomyces sp. NRRL WC-3742]|uniref:sialidase family protein n=1 Tax=Streptomyces sp. NRRL WC-3742 TaxID=1463934 RepID=UPI0007C4A52D|nr:sialidase family protein [Streptomyces sp. NRRL WC-3742]
MQFRTRAPLATASAALLLAALAAGAPAGAATGDAKPGAPLALISPGDPYAACDISADGSGTNHLSAEEEPYASSNPLDPANTITIYQQDRWSNGGARGLSSSYTTDGVHFTQTALPFTHCTPGGLPYQRASDGWVSFGPDGTAYASALIFDATTPRNAVAAATSYDGGRSWQHVTELITDNDPAIGDDKNAVTADPVHPGVAYQVWDRLDQVGGASPSFDGPGYISITRDHGRTWSTAAPFVITSTVANSQTIGNQIVVDPRTDTLYDFFSWITYTDATASTVSEVHYGMVSSTDQGRTWSPPVRVVADTSVPEVHPNAPTDATKSLRAGAGLPSVAIDPQTGELYLAYEGSDFNGGAYDAIQLVHSTDGGRTWSDPARLNQAPNAPAFTPSITVARDGTVAVSYYDLRYLTAGDTATLPTAAWLLSFPRGGENSPVERQISPVFDWLQAPYAGGHFLGDYQALVNDGRQIRPVMVTANTDPLNSTDVYSGRFQPGTLRSPAAGNPAAQAGHPAGPRTAQPLRR